MKPLEKDFLPWLSDVLQTIYKLERDPDNKAAVEVPCGDCQICCHNSKVVVTAKEAKNLALEARRDVLKPGDGVETWYIPKDESRACIHLTTDGPDMILRHSVLSCGIKI